MENYSKIKRRIFSSILVISLTALLFSCAFISIANDVYAFVKRDAEVSLTVDKPHSVKTLSKILEQNGVIENPTVFTAYVRSKHKEAVIENFYGDITLNSSMSYREILSAFSTRQ